MVMEDLFFLVHVYHVLTNYTITRHAASYVVLTFKDK